MFAAATIASGSALVNVKLPLLSYVSVLMLPAGVCELTLRVAPRQQNQCIAILLVDAHQIGSHRDAHWHKLERHLPLDLRQM